MRSPLTVADLQHTQGQLSRRPRNATPLLPAFAHTRFAHLIRLSQTPRSDRSCRRYVHQCIDTVSAWTECHDKEHATHHREVSEEGVSVNPRCRRVTYGPIGMENQRKRKRVKEKGKSYPTGIKPGHQHHHSEYLITAVCKTGRCAEG